MSMPKVVPYDYHNDSPNLSATIDGKRMRINAGIAWKMPFALEG